MPRLHGGARNRPLPPQKRGNRRTPTNLETRLEDLKRLKTQIRQLEGFGGKLADGNRKVLPLGVAEIDDHFPGGGLAQGALHEIFAADAGIATAFCALLAGRLASDEETAPSILWCERPWALDAGALYGPALLQFGIDPARVILVRTRRDADALWAMEQGLHCGRIAAVVGEITNMSLTESRRLQLAAEETGVTALMLRPRTDKPAPSAAATRWRLDAVEHPMSAGNTTQHAPGPVSGLANDNELNRSISAQTGFQPGPPGLNTARWHAELFRCRGGISANWMMEWNDETGNFSVAAEVRDRSPVPSAARLAG